jgi:cation diffusion facilitator CzcD-associated flavoprotein CzcO
MSEPDFEVVVIGVGVGIGIGVIAAAHQLQRKGIDDFVILERGDDFGGTWRDNHYPGPAVDIPTPWYQLSLARLRQREEHRRPRRCRASRRPAGAGDRLRTLDRPRDPSNGNRTGPMDST